MNSGCLFCAMYYMRKKRPPRYAYMAVSILLVPSVFLIEGGTGVLLHYIGYNESTPVYMGAPFLDSKQKINSHMAVSHLFRNRELLQRIRSRLKGLYMSVHENRGIIIS